MMTMMMMCKRLAQVPMLCVPIYNMKLAIMQKTPIFITFSAHTKMAADKRGQIEVFARNTTFRRRQGTLLLNNLVPHTKNMFSLEKICVHIMFASIGPFQYFSDTVKFRKKQKHSNSEKPPFEKIPRDEERHTWLQKIHKSIQWMNVHRHFWLDW